MGENEYGHQKVRLIGVTSGWAEELVGPGYVMGNKKYPGKAEDIISYCARVSNPANQDKFDTAGKLLTYLIKHAHWSPFEMVHVNMEIITTRDIGRQILRHRSFSFQEFSQRYAEKGERFPTDEYRECRLQDKKNRQNSIDTDDDMLAANWLAAQIKVENAALDAYNWALKAGIAKEQARAVLPEGLTMSRMYMSGTLRSWIHYCDLRRGSGTQKEHIDIAEKAWNILLNEFQFLQSYEDSKSEDDAQIRLLAEKLGYRLEKL